MFGFGINYGDVALRCKMPPYVCIDNQIETARSSMPGKST